MITKDKLAPFLNRKIHIGVPHHFRPWDIWYYTGELIQLDDEILTIRNHNNTEIVLGLSTIVYFSPSGTKGYGRDK